MNDIEQRKIFSNNLRRYVDRSGKTQKEIAEAIGVSAQTFNTWMQGIAIPRMGKIQALSDYFNINKSNLIDPIDNEPGAIHPLTNRGQIPVFGRIPAGVPIDAIQDVSGYIDVPSDWVDDHGALIVKGNSMEPKYFDGDTVIFRVQPDCESGQDCIVYINGYDATLKKVIKTEAGIILQPLNPEYTPIICGPDNPATILGVVVELRRKV